MATDAYPTPRLYDEFASWFHLLTAPADYANEAAFYLAAFSAALGRPPETWLELGSGGGNMASHYREHVRATLVDRAPAMLVISRALNPGCEHIEGDMRDVRLGRTFDAVFVHDAVSYLTTADDVRAAMDTAFAHTRPGGAVIFVPDCTRESFVPGIHSGGHDGQGDDPRALRYLEWDTDPDPADSWYQADFAYLLRDGTGPVRVEHDTHRCGLFATADWLRWLEQAGFRASALPAAVEDAPPGYTMFRGVRPGA